MELSGAGTCVIETTASTRAHDSTPAATTCSPCYSQHPRRCRQTVRRSNYNAIHTWLCADIATVRREIGLLWELAPVPYGKGVASILSAFATSDLFGVSTLN